MVLLDGPVTQPADTRRPMQTMKFDVDKTKEQTGWWKAEDVQTIRIRPA